MKSTPLLQALGWLGFFVASAALPAAPPEARNIVSYHDKNTGLTIIEAEIMLPAPFAWQAAHPANEAIYLNPGETIFEEITGRRNTRIELARDQRETRFLVSTLAHAIEQYAKKHDNEPPASLKDLHPWIDDKSLKLLVETFHLFPDATIDRSREPKDATIVAMETAPMFNDGMHWVLLSDGQGDLRKIDPELVAKAGVTVRPRHKPSPGRPSEGGYQILARAPAAKPFTIHLKNTENNATARIDIDPAKATAGDAELLTSWAGQRFGIIARDNTPLTSTILPHWYRQADVLYHTKPERFTSDLSLFPGRRENNDLTIFGILGGRAAVAETLQLQDISESTNRAQPKEVATTSVPIANITGVEVKSHPFEEMLGKQSGGRLPLADIAPADRLFAYFPRPADLTTWLDGGTEILFHAGSSATGRQLQHNLTERYLAAFGVDRKWLQKLLESGAVAESAVILPDLFLIDGTEITLVARLKNPLLAAGILQLLGIADNKPPAARTHQGETSYWARRGDLLLASTHEGELNRVLQVHGGSNKESLGRSAEFRYMLTKLPPGETTRAYVYLSDPFLRRLVGPATKIAQHRRMRARGEMEALLAGSLLRRWDGAPDTSIADLVAKHYVPSMVVATDAALDAKAGVVSKTYGPLARMHSLLDLDITTATADEANAYRRYLENYNTYWRKYYDPIALRIDQPSDTTYELSLFILPLVENTIYNGLRSIITSEQPGKRLPVPVIEPASVATLSFNLNERFWDETLSEMSRDFALRGGINSKLLDYIASDVHLAVADSDAVIDTGTEMLGTVATFFGNSREMVMIPALVSLFTRPTAICVGLTDPAAARRALDQSTGRPPRMWNGELDGRFFKYGGQWIYQMDIFGIISLRLAVEIQDRYLVIRNVPLTTSLRITGSKDAALGDAQLVLNPQACNQQLPALFLSACTQQSKAAFNSMEYLQPILLSGIAKSPDEAAALHQDWFGIKPAHPGDGQWKWDGNVLASSVFGSLWQPVQPVYQPGNRNFGLLQNAAKVSLSMHITEDGLHTTARFETRTPGEK